MIAPIGINTAGRPAEDVISYQTVHEVLPALVRILGQLELLKRAWNGPLNGIPAKIVAAAQAGEALGGYAPADWARWGQTLLALDVFLATQIEIALPDGSTEMLTPLDVLIASYAPVAA